MDLVTVGISEQNQVSECFERSKFLQYRKLSADMIKKIDHELFKQFIAETFGTCLMILVGLSGGAQIKFMSKDNSYLLDTLAPNIMAGLSLSISILVFGKVTKAHFNPAISLAVLLNKQMKLLEFFVYIIAQFLGSFLGAVLVFLIYFDALYSYEKKFSMDTAAIFVTSPTKHVTIYGIIFDQIIGTCVYLILILALTDKKNVRFSHEGTALIVGVALFIICSTLSYNSGSPLNPARDLSPRVFLSISGWGRQVFTNGNYYFWIPIVCPMIGAMIGTAVYWLLVARNLK